MVKLGKNENALDDALEKICQVLDCGIDNIMEILAEKTQHNVCSTDKGDN